ncbi:thiolase family protein [Streptomyces sp. NPDC046805]|uniref:thiolase family protein n=1 Tax=Streptomyces sp. NPDC046805 TaxID=3155134 RepID=UPI003407C5B2
MGQTKAAVIGVGTTDFSAIYRQKDPFRTEYALGLEALDLAVADAGISKDDIDGVLLSRIDGYEMFCSMAGLRYPKVVNTYEGAGRMAGVVIQHAVALIEAGLATTIACVYGNNGRSAGATYGGDGGGGAYNARLNDAKFDMAYGMTSPGAYVSMMYRRYAHDYNVPDGALAPIALSNRANAQKNPIAVMKADLTEEDYLSSRFIAEPLRLYDYCMINDGGVAIIVTSAERARDTKQPVVKIVATEGVGDLTNYYTKEDNFRASSEEVAARLRASSGVGPDDVDCVQIYDNFTPIVLFSLEHFGFAPQGEGWQFIQKGRIALDGELPINTSGGHTSEGYMQGWGLQVEAVRQLRGECGERQVANARTSQYICVSPIVTSHIFQRED